MTTKIPDEGLDWVADRMIFSDASDLGEVAVGNGDTEPAAGDSSLESELYRASSDQENCTIERSSSLGEIQCTITISGGTEVDAGSQISELGLFSLAGDLVYREVRSSVEINEGERVTFEFEVVAQDG